MILSDMTASSFRNVGNHLLLVFLVAAGTPGRVSAEAALVEAAVPVQLTRTLRTFDFEERARGNVEETPNGWVKVEGTGLPRYVHGSLDTTSRAASGTGTFRFDLDGGSVAYRFPGTRTPVMPRARYRISTLVRTTPLKYARAQVTAYFCDTAGRPIVESVRHSRPIVNDADRFAPLSLDLVADDADAASLVVELGLLQPALLDDVHDEAAKLAEDIHGSCWFDDVRITQVPDFTLTTDRPLNVFKADEAANLRVRVSDRVTADLTAEIRVTDADGVAVFQRTGPMQFPGNDDRRPRPRVGTVAMPPLAPGWYAVRLTLRSQGQFVDERSLALIRLGDAMTPARPDTRFGIVATDVAPDGWPLLPGVADTIGAGRVKVSVWTHDYSIDGTGSVGSVSGGDTASAKFEQLLDTLGERDLALTACLAAPPPDVRAKMTDATSGAWIDVNHAPREQWQPQLAYLLARHAGPRTNWQFADDASADLFAREPTYRDAFTRVEGEYQPLIGDAHLVMPWPALFEIGDQPLPASVALDVPVSVLPDQIPLYLNDFLTGSVKRDVAVVIHPIDRARYGRDAQRADLALRIANALAGGATRVDLPMSMSITTDDEHLDPPIAEPDELLIAERVVTSQLANARYAGMIHLAPGVDAFVFDRDGVGVMLLRGRGPDAPPTVTLALGGKASLITLDGTITPLAQSHSADRDAFEVPIGSLPVFITGVDAALLRLRTSIAIDNPLIESTAGTTARALTFTNTFDTPISGTVRLTGPSGWLMSMPTMNYSLNPGETFHGAITLTLPGSTQAGERPLVADVRVDAYGTQRHLTAPLSLRVGLSDVGLQSFALRDGPDLVVQQTITNYGSKPIDYTCYAVLPGQARQERIVSNLAPGRSTIRKFRFPTPGATVAKVRSGIREINGHRMLNQDVALNP